MGAEPGMSKTQTPPLGTGGVARAATAMQGRPYRMHVEEAKALGQRPMTPEEFAAQQRGG